jgi:Domain of unknown function (DUF4258)
MVGKPLVLSKHAQDMIEEREIPLEWIEHVLQHRIFEEPDRQTPGAIRAYAPIAAFGNRVLRVVYVETGSVIRVITLFFDRQATRRMRAQ